MENERDVIELVSEDGEKISLEIVDDFFFNGTHYAVLMEDDPEADPYDYDRDAFLARIVRNLSVDACRRQNRLKRRADVVSLSAEMEECIPAPDDTAARMEAIGLGEAVGRYLGTLTAEKRIVFVRRYWYLDPIPAIAERMNMGQSKVKMMLSRMRRGLREYLRKEGYVL